MADTAAVDGAPLAEAAALQTADDLKPEAHEQGTGEEHATTTPAVNVDDGGNGECYVEDVLDRRRDEVTAAAGKTSTLADVDDVVPVRTM